VEGAGTATFFVILTFCFLFFVIVVSWTALAKEWPTSEMVTRGSWTNFLVGLPIAFFSGLGVAVSLLDDQTSSLVGVAISASLLPPAVNSGILWIAYWFQEQDWLGVSIPVQAPEELGKEFPDDDGFELTRQDFTTAGIVSLTLTLANIALIIISSMIMFRCKERYVSVAYLLGRRMIARWFASSLSHNSTCFHSTVFLWKRISSGTILEWRGRSTET
jgi:uncharacterized membrane protein